MKFQYAYVLRYNMYIHINETRETIEGKSCKYYPYHDVVNRVNWIPSQPSSIDAVVNCLQKYPTSPHPSSEIREHITKKIFHTSFYSWKGKKKINVNFTQTPPPPREKEENIFFFISILKRKRRK